MDKISKKAAVSLALLSSIALTAEGLAETITPDLKDFSRVELRTAANVNIKVGGDYSVRVTADEDLLEKTEVIVKRDRLIIKRKNENGRFFSRDDDGDMQVDITMPDIVEMEVNGSGDTEIEGVDNQELELRINGSGNLNVSGKSEKLDISINGSGDIEMDEVAGGDVDVSVNGSGDVELVTGTCSNLEIDINGSGSVRAKDVKCQDVNVDVSGSGDSMVYASSSITFDSHGSGSVDVYGKPETVIDREAKRRSRINIH